ncbi:unnamed protein product [Vicia faba]|uniref:BED-type domain-containing protein n=1 Tax=Vicia faba TaxID=3906 RepID=A0AAV0ZUA6_VICFA|nr:unnamed protein product [Vicia faba]
MTNVSYLPTYATSENTISTPLPIVSNEIPSPHNKKRKNHSGAWNHFIISSEEEHKASCKYCDTKIKYNNGTSFMHALLSRYLVYKRQRTSSSMTSVEEHVGSLLIVKFDQEAIRRAMVKMFINMEIPFWKACIDEESMDYKGLVSLDVETRWNSTYLMLVSALKYERTFEELGFQNKRYVIELTKKGKGVPMEAYQLNHFILEVVLCCHCTYTSNSKDEKEI